MTDHDPSIEADDVEGHVAASPAQFPQLEDDVTIEDELATGARNTLCLIRCVGR